MIQESNDFETLIDNLRPVDDTFFHKLVEQKEFCEELLQVLLEKPDLKIVDFTPQKSLRNVKGKSIIMDLLCKDIENKHYNIEIQRFDNDNHQKRVRYNGSNIDTYITEKGIPYTKLPDVYVIYISEFDVFKKQKAIYHIDRIIRETHDIVDNGYTEIYICTSIQDDSDISELMQIFKSRSIPNNTKFSNICKTIKYFKIGKGRQDMCKLMEEYKAKWQEEEKLNLLFDLVNDKILTIEEASKRADLTPDEFTEKFHQQN